MPQKKYIVRLTAQEREICQQTVRKLNGSSEKVRRAQILLKADADGPGWTDQQIAYAISCRTKTVENIRERCVLEGFERALERKRRALPQGLKLLDGEQEAQVTGVRRATRTGVAKKVRRAQILLKAEMLDGGEQEAQVAYAISCAHQD